MKNRTRFLCQRFLSIAKSCAWISFPSMTLPLWWIIWQTQKSKQFSKVNYTKYNKWKEIGKKHHLGCIPTFWLEKMHTYIWQETGLILLPSYWLILQNYKFFFLSEDQGSQNYFVILYDTNYNSIWRELFLDQTLFFVSSLLSTVHMALTRHLVFLLFKKLNRKKKTQHIFFPIFYKETDFFVAS